MVLWGGIEEEKKKTILQKKDSVYYWVQVVQLSYLDKEYFYSL